MSKLSFSVYLNAYSDKQSTNAPDLNNVKWNRSLNCVPVNNANSQALTIAPGQTSVLFNGSRTLAHDSTTNYSIALKPLSTQTYVLSAVSGTLPNFRTPRSISDDATTQVVVTTNGPVVTFTGAAVAAAYASYSGTPTGALSAITLTAVTIGAGGNLILLVGDGTSSINTLITNWNTANASNTVALTIGDGTQIPSLGAQIKLAGGLNAATAFNLATCQVGDFVQVGSNFSQLNQGTWQIIALTSNSFSVNNPQGVGEGPILLGASFASQIAICSAAGVQVGDTLIISGGFSLVTQGSYVVTAVSANSLEFYTTGVLPQEGPIQTQAIAIYSAAKSLIYLESDAPLSVIVNGVTVASILPFIVNACVTPGVFLLKSTVYSLSVNNAGVNPANMLLIAAE